MYPDLKKWSFNNPIYQAKKQKLSVTIISFPPLFLKENFLKIIHSAFATLSPLWNPISIVKRKNPIAEAIQSTLLGALKLELYDPNKENKKQQNLHGWLNKRRRKEVGRAFEY